MNEAIKAQAATEQVLQQGWATTGNGIFSYCASSFFHLLFVITATLCLFAGCLYWFTIQYQTNDDVGMNMIAAGRGLAQQPSEFILFQHFLIGLLLKSLYLSLPEIPWYGILLYVYPLLSSTALGYAVLRLNVRPGVIGLWLVQLMLFYSTAIVSPQFTICAGFLGISGVILLYSTIYKPQASKKINLCLMAAASGLLILAGLIRFQGVLLATVLLAPLYIYALVTNAALALRRLLPAIFCTICLSALLDWGQQKYYEHSPGWERFHSYNHVMADFTTRGNVVWNERTQPLFQKIGWSQNDLAMIQHWFYLDPVRYSFQNLRFISQNIPFVPQHKMAWPQVFNNLKDSLLSHHGLAVLLLGVLLLGKAMRLIRLLTVLSFIWYCGLFISISVVEKNLPLRVWLVMLFGLYAMELVFWCQTSAQRLPQTAIPKKQRIIAWASSLLVIAGYLVFCQGQLKEMLKLSDQHRANQQSAQADLARLQPRADQLFVVWGRFPYEGFQPPTQAMPLAREMQLLGLGVGNQEPIVQNRLKSLGITDLYQSFYTRENIFLISNDNVNKLLIQYIQEHYQTKVEIKPVFLGATFTVNKVSKLL